MIRRKGGESQWMNGSCLYPRLFAWQTPSSSLRGGTVKREKSPHPPRTMSNEGLFLIEPGEADSSPGSFYLYSTTPHLCNNKLWIIDSIGN